MSDTPIEKMAPITTSPLDSMRGRGKRKVKKKIMSERVQRDSIGSDIPINTIIIQIGSETSSPTVGGHVKHK